VNVNEEPMDSPMPASLVIVFNAVWRMRQSSFLSRSTIVPRAFAISSWHSPRETLDVHANEWLTTDQHWLA